MTDLYTGRASETQNACTLKLVLVIPALVGILLTSVLACNNADPEAVLARAQVELDKHRTLWEQTGSPDYTYEYYLGCLCLASTGQTLKVTVTNGEVESATYAGSGMMGKPGDTPVFPGPAYLPHHRQLVPPGPARHH